MVTYKRPQSISTLLTNYQKLAHNKNNEEEFSSPCGKCLLWKDTIVKKTSLVKLKNRKTKKFKKKLKLQKICIYAAKCSEVEMKSSMSARQSRPFAKMVLS